MKASQFVPDLLAVAVAGLCSACAGDKSNAVATDGGAAGQVLDVSADALAVQSVTLRFEGRVGASRFDCAKEFPDLGKSLSRVVPLDFRLYVHDVRLTRADGADVAVALDQDKKWQYQDTVLLDFEDRTGGCSNGTVDTNFMVKGAVPPGRYNGLTFRLGVPFALNHANAATAPSPLNLTTLWWGWNGGYKFLRVDTRVSGVGGMPNVFNIHLGSVNCAGDADLTGTVTACKNPNRATITFAAFDTAREKVLVDYAALVATTNLAEDGGGQPGCMSDGDDPECKQLLPRIGIDGTTGQPISGQVFFGKE